MMLSPVNLYHVSLLSILLLFQRAHASPMQLAGLDQPQLPLDAPSPPSPPPTPTTTPGTTASPIILGVHLVPRDPAPQTTCAPNSGTQNTGCGNSGVSNSGTRNSGVCLTGTGQSGVGDCSISAEAIATSVYVLGTATTVYLAQTVTVSGNTVVTTVQSVFAAGATATQTVVADNGRYNRPGCAYWRTQGYICSAAGKGFEVERWLFWPVVGVVALVAAL